MWRLSPKQLTVKTLIRNLIEKWNHAMEESSICFFNDHVHFPRTDEEGIKKKGHAFSLWYGMAFKTTNFDVRKNTKG